MRRMDDAEKSVHGRSRDVTSLIWNADPKKDSIAEEARFGVLHEPVMLARGLGIEGAQWTGCVTGIALSMLEKGHVDAVVCIAKSESDDWCSPEPIIAKTPEDVLRGRGVKPALAPSLRVLDEIKADKSIRKLLFCGVGCAVQAFRAVEQSLCLDEVFVLGTNCVDNSPTPEAAQEFVQKGLNVKEDAVQGYEFMQDFKVHVKTESSYIKKPYFVLPGSIAESSIATSCLACFDYTNGLADVVIGYMGAPLNGNEKMNEAYQTLTIRNERGGKMVENAINSNRLKTFGTANGTGAHEKLAVATVNSDSIVLNMLGKKVPEKGMPLFIGEIMATIMRSVGPKGISFARYSIDYHILRNYLHVLKDWGALRAKQSMPQYSMEIVQKYIQTDKKFAEICERIIDLSPNQ